MKVDELIKHLGNIKTDENKIDEKREIAEYLAQVFDGSVIPATTNFMMKDKTVYGFDSYVNLFRTRRISPDDAFVYVGSYYTSGTFPVDYLYPFLTDKYLLRNAYLSKLGCGPSDCSTYAPARGLKYVSMASIFTDATART